MSHLVTVFKEFTFEAAHRLTKVPDGHKCARLHGHSYHVRVEVSGRVGRSGMLIDYAHIGEAWGHLFERLDHQCLNEVMEVETTSENLAKWIADRLPDWPQCKVSVTVRETPTAGATYRR